MAFREVSVSEIREVIRAGLDGSGGGPIFSWREQAWVLVIVATLTTSRSCNDHVYDTN